jgi:prophage regulatory protein
VTTPVRILRIADVCEIVGICRASIYNWMKTDPAFPKPVRIGTRNIGFRSDEVAAYVESRPKAVA